MGKGMLPGREEKRGGTVQAMIGRGIDTRKDNAKHVKTAGLPAPNPV
jgi:hypothetical protein